MYTLDPDVYIISASLHAIKWPIMQWFSRGSMAALALLEDIANCMIKGQYVFREQADFLVYNNKLLMRYHFPRATLLRL